MTGFEPGSSGIGSDAQSTVTQQLPKADKNLLYLMAPSVQVNLVKI